MLPGFVAIALLAGCGGSEERDFAEAISEENQRWVEQGERPVADLVLRLASQPATIGDRRGEIVASLESALSLNEQALSSTRKLKPPGEMARICQEEQIVRLEAERNWLDGLKLAISQMADASAIAMLPTFRDLGAAITKADESCSSFIAQVD